MLACKPLTTQGDQIILKWTANGHYSVASAIECQFKGSMAYFPAAQVYKAKAEPKG
jgi:hypothetical protein